MLWYEYDMTKLCYVVHVLNCTTLIDLEEANTMFISQPGHHVQSNCEVKM